MARFLYKYGACLLWFIIVLIFALTQSIWYGISALIIGLTIGFSYDDIYNEYIRTKKQRRYLIENIIGLLILSAIILTGRIWLIITTVLVICGLHLLRNRVID